MTQNTLIDSKELVVVITGADSGFGAGIVEELNRRGGYTIYATCLTKEAVEKYQARDSDRLRATQVDVTNQDDVNRLRTQVEAECPQSVYCVFNNAGMSLCLTVVVVNVFMLHEQEDETRSSSWTYFSSF